MNLGRGSPSQAAEVDTDGKVNSRKRVDGFDYVKGILVILVLVGHYVLGEVDTNWIRYTIYAFHMPVFIGVAGYLLNVDSLLTSTLKKVFVRYWHRLLVPFIPALVIYNGYALSEAALAGKLNLDLVIYYIHTPYYHLWFIPAMMFWIVATRYLLASSIISWGAFLGFSIIALIWACIPHLEQGKFLSALTGKKVVYYYAFFLAGTLLAKHQRILTDLRFIKCSGVLFVVSAIFYLSHFEKQISYLSGSAWLTMNFSLLILTIVWAEKNEYVRGKIGKYITAIGRNSLPIYMWHMLPLVALLWFDLHTTTQPGYYFLGAISLIWIVVTVIHYESANRLLAKYLYGIPADALKSRSQPISIR